MKNVRKLLKKFVNFCRKSLKKDLKGILLFGSSVSSISKAKDMDLIVVLGDNSDKGKISLQIKKFTDEKLKTKNSRESADIPFTEIREDNLFNIVVAKESDIKSENLKRIFDSDRYLISFFVPSSLVLLSLKDNHKVLFGNVDLKSWKVNINFLDYMKTLTRSLFLSLFSLILLLISVKKSFSVSCDSLKHLLQNVFILETHMPSKNVDLLLKFYKPSWWVDILSKYRNNETISTQNKIKFILTMPIITIAIFVEAFI